MADPPTLAHGTGGAFRRVPLGREELVIRFATPDDRDALAELFDSLSFDDRYLRFFSAFRPDDRFLERLAGANEHGARELIAVIAAAGNDRRLVGEAGAWPLGNGNGELEITVAPGHRGWLGPYLLDAALEAAAEAGMPNVEADVMLSNREMLALLRSRGVAVVGHDGYISIRIVISTSGRVPTWAPKDGRPRVLVETLDGRWNGDDAVKNQPLQVVACPGPAARPSGRGCPALGGEPCPLAAGADAIFVHLPDDADRDALLEAHRSLHPGVSVCVKPLDDDSHVVQLVDRISGAARDHTRA